MNKRAVGARYEALALSYMEAQGMEIVTRNYRCRQGEIDIIAREGKYLLFVEVKYRRDKQAGYPEEAVTMQKQQRIRQVAGCFLYERHLSEDTPVRFDVAAILGEDIRYIRNAF